MKRNTLELVGFVSVIASLIFVGMEIRQNTTAVRGSTNQAISDQATELYLAMATDRNIARLTVRLYDGALRKDFDPVDDMQLFLTVMTGLRRVENIFLQLEDNILDDSEESIGFFNCTLISAACPANTNDGVKPAT